MTTNAVCVHRYFRWRSSHSVFYLPKCFFVIFLAVAVVVFVVAAGLVSLRSFRYHQLLSMPCCEITIYSLLLFDALYSWSCRLFYDYYHWIWHHGMWRVSKRENKCNKIGSLISISDRIRNRSVKVLCKFVSTEALAAQSNHGANGNVLQNQE